ncbi:endochitinase isoform X1 [Rhipicephalus microplus]|uniref:endochitinase isoform X1 n=1 Tax=Rhipicephalus microplus TaxID=6941 RepID=UPI003F6CC4E0
MEPQNVKCCCKNWITALCCILLWLFSPSAAVFIENFSHGRILPVVCYYEKGQALRPYPMNYDTSDVPGHLCSHVNLAFMELNRTTYTIQEDHTVKFTDFAQLKKKFPRLKTFISVGGWSNQTRVISAMTSRRERRKAFIKDAKKLLVDHDFDGLDIHWLFPGFADQGGRNSDKVNFVRLLKELYAAFKAHNLLLTAAIPINQQILDNGYDIRAIDRYVDWMNVIGYDIRGYWNGRTDVHSPLHRRSIDGNDTADLNVETGLQVLLGRGASKRKLVLGVAFYGRVYRLSDPQNVGLHAPIDLVKKPQRGAFLMSDNIHAYFEICKNIKFGSWRRSFDSQGMCPYATNGQDWVGYEDEESIAKKVEFVRKEGYAGIMVLSSDMDDFLGVCGTHNILLQTINSGIRRLRNFVVSRSVENERTLR